MSFTRRTFIRLSAAASAVARTPVLLRPGVARAQERGGSPLLDAIVGTVEDGVGRDYSPATGMERQKIPSACWQCVARDGILCFVEDGRLMHVEGNPDLPRTNGKLCAKGHAAPNQVYDPDRLLFPMKRVGARGDGQWKRITWEEALAAIGTGTKVVTVDPRLSNTAARSSQWVPIRPGTDLALVLAMTYHIVDGGLVPGEGAAFVDTWTGSSLAELTDFLQHPKDHVGDDLKDQQPAGGYTPQWAADLTGIPADTIRTLAEEYAAASPGSTVISYRGATQHYNGVQCERAILMLEALCGNVDVPGGRVHTVGASWKYSTTYPKPSNSTSKLAIVDGEGYALPSHHASHQVLRMIRDNPDLRPDVYMVYCYTPVYANGDVQENIDILKDESIIPHYYNVNTSYDESAALADILLPDATYLERWDWEDMVSMDMVPEYYIRQPAVAPLGEARDFKDVLHPLALEIGDAALIETLSFETAEEFVRAACEDTPDVSAAGGFEYMKQHGALVPEGAVPKYQGYLSEVDPGDAHLDEATGVYWSASADETTGEFPDYRGTKKAYKNYVAQKVGDKIYAGFPPDKLNKSGLYEIKSPLLEDKGWPGFPAWMIAPEHVSLADDELILTTFKVAAQIHSRSQNCKYLTELYHDNPAWLNPVTAATLDVADGDEVLLTPQAMQNGGVDATPTRGSMKFVVKLTEGIVPGVIAASHHLGHWAYGRYASGNANPMAGDSADHVAGDTDLSLKWWDEFGRHPNWVIPNAGDPIAGTQRWMDTVVKVARV